MTVLKRFDYVVGRQVANEAMSRSRLDDILMCAIADERLRHEHRQTSSTLGPIGDNTPKPLILKFETYLSWSVKYLGEDRELQGKADYSLWYDGHDDLGSNLAVVEAKRYGESGKAEAQLLAYMGKCHSVPFSTHLITWKTSNIVLLAIAHRIRVRGERRDCAVYGLATDGFFKFYKLDGESTVSISLLRYVLSNNLLTWFTVAS